MYEKSLYKNVKHISGLSVMVRDICDEISKACECYVLPYRLPNKCIKKINNIYILQSGITKLLCYFSIRHLLRNIVRFLFNKNKWIIFEQPLEKYVLSLYKSYNFDLINFHDFAPETIRLIKTCDEKKIPYVVTMHMYIGSKYKEQNDVIKRHGFYSSFVYGVLNSLSNMKIVTISTGMKNRILEDHPNIKPQNITAILNTSNYIENVLQTKSSSETSNKKIFLIIGAVQPCKNQVQLFSALKHISNDIKSQIEIYIIGSDPQGIISQIIKDNNADSFVKYIGLVQHNNLATYYKKCFATISLSLVEGFGLTFIESFAFGKPVVMFDDLDAFEDIYTEDCCVPITEHTDEAVANAIINCVNKTWDEAKIKQHAKKFNMDTLRESYISLYNNILNNDTTENNSRNRL